MIDKKNNLPRKNIFGRISLSPGKKSETPTDKKSILLPFLPHTFMAKRKLTESKTLKGLFGKTNDVEVSKKLMQKLMQYNMKYEEITKVILSHSERAFLDARLITLEEYYRELQSVKKSEVENFLSSIPDYELAKV